MKIEGQSVLVTGGASGLGRATPELLVAKGARVTICDLPTSSGAETANALGARFAAADVTETQQLETALDQAAGAGPLRAVVQSAGRGVSVHVVERDGTPGSLEAFEGVVRTNLIGSFNVPRQPGGHDTANQMVNGETIRLDGAIRMPPR